MLVLWFLNQYLHQENEQSLVLSMVFLVIVYENEIDDLKKNRFFALVVEDITELDSKSDATFSFNAEGICS